MKDLYGITQEDVDRLKEAGLIPEDIYIGEYGKSECDGSMLYWVNFNNSVEKQKAFDFLYN